MDYGFHAPTLSSGRRHADVEPTRASRSRARSIHRRDDCHPRGNPRGGEGRVDRDDNPLKNAPHTAAMVMAENWAHDYAVSGSLPLASLKRQKYWPPVGRVDNAYGDRTSVFLRADVFVLGGCRGNAGVIPARG